MIGAAKGYKVIITVSEKISEEKLKTLYAYGAEVIMCPLTEFIDDEKSYHYVARNIAEKTPNSFMPNQYYNEENRDAHYQLLGPELWEQTHGTITHFFAGAGTGGTVSGVGRYLKKQNSKVKIFGIDSVNSLRATCGKPQPYKVEGIGIDFHSDVIDYNVIDEIVAVSDAEAIKEINTFAHNYGLLVGPSSGAVAAAMRHYQTTFTKDDVVVLTFSDSGRAYLSKGFYDIPDKSAGEHKTADQPYNQPTPYPEVSADFDPTTT